MTAIEPAEAPVDYWAPPLGIDVPEPVVCPGVHESDALQVLPPGVSDNDRGLWLAVRRTGIGGSDVSGILGLNRWTSRFEVYADKRGEIPWQDPDSDAARLGVKLEPVVRDLYTEDVLPPDTTISTHGGTLRSVRWPWLMVNPDGIICRREYEPGMSCAVYPRTGYEGKALDVDTPILTTHGWTTMGELEVGDEVYHPDGHPTRVVGAFNTMRGHDCYRVTTTDGRSIVADADHLWTVRAGQRGSWETGTTRQLLAAGLVMRDRSRPREYRFQLPRQQALTTKPVDLPLDPYLLGAWLGDGSAGSARVHSGDADVDEMIGHLEGAGADVTFARQHTAWALNLAMREGPSFGARLRAMGIWQDKRVPEEYLAAGTEQRLALLQGLLDTDGSISTRGQVEFSACREDIARAVLFLARSLGWRANMTVGPTALAGQPMQDRWRVRFTPAEGDPEPFRLYRKVARMHEATGTTRGDRHARIASIEPVESRPVRCIRVERADGLFLAGRDLVPTHNTASMWMAHEWENGQVPDHAEVQCQIVMAVCGFVGMHVGCLLGGQRPEYRYVERDDDLIRDLVEITEEFWHDHILAGVEPDPDASVACEEFLTRRYPRAMSTLPPVVAGPEDVAKIVAMRQNERAANTYVKAANEGKNLARQLMGEAEELHDADGRTVATWRQTGKFDAAAFALDHPELAAKYTRDVPLIDAAQLAEDEPALYAAYRGRTLLVK